MYIMSALVFKPVMINVYVVVLFVSKKKNFIEIIWKVKNIFTRKKVFSSHCKVIEPVKYITKTCNDYVMKKIVEICNLTNIVNMVVLYQEKFTQYYKSKQLQTYKYKWKNFLSANKYCFHQFVFTPVK